MSISRRRVVQSMALAPFLLSREARGQSAASQFEGYVSSPSVRPGDDLTFHLGDEARVPADGSALAGSFQAVAYKRGESSFSHDFGLFNVGLQKSLPEPWLTGCGWNGLTVRIPSHWSSGLYYMRVTGLGASTDIPFIVRGVGAAGKTILVQLPIATHLAYNLWGPGLIAHDSDGNEIPRGKCLYDFGLGGSYSPKVHLHRPRLMATNDYEYWLRWAQVQPFVAEIDYATSFDLHADPALLDNYRVFISIGHDEYVSKEMRDHLEAFIANGGHACFFTGNTCWWHVRFNFSGPPEFMVSYKNHPDPIVSTVTACRPGDITPCVPDTGHPSPDPFRNTSPEWFRLEHEGWRRPEALLTGLSFERGAHWSSVAVKGPRPAEPYIVSYPRYWVYSGTGLGNGATFGTDRNIVGYEVDALSEDSPRNHILLAHTENLLDRPIDPWEVAFNPTEGRAHMVLFRRNGLVFNAGTVEWSSGLVTAMETPASSGPVHQITTNLLTRMRERSAAVFPLKNAGFERWHQGLPVGWSLEGAGAAAPARKQETLTSNSTLILDGHTGHTWLSQGFFECSASSTYRVGCWVRWSRNGYSGQGPVVRLQSNHILPGNIGGVDFVSGEEPAGDGRWHFVTAVGRPAPEEGTAFLARLKLEVPAGVAAEFDDVVVERVEAIDGQWHHGVPVHNASFEIWPGSAECEGWSREGAAPLAQGTRSGGGRTLVIDASGGHTWASQNLGLVERLTFYRVGCWVRATGSGAHVRLQSNVVLEELGNVGGIDFVSAQHSGSGQWEYVTAYGVAHPAEGVMFDARVKLEVEAGTWAEFDDVSVDIIGSGDVERDAYGWPLLQSNGAPIVKDLY